MLASRRACPARADGLLKRTSAQGQGAIQLLSFTHYCGKTREGHLLLCQKIQRKPIDREIPSL